MFKSNRRAVTRLKVMKQQRRRESVQRQATCMMFVVLMSVACRNLLPKRMLWTKERSSHWWEHVVNSRTSVCHSRPFCTM